MYYPRQLENEIIHSLETNPVTAITGPRQCGKSTLARRILKAYDNAVYLDLERPSDLEKLNNPEWFFKANKGKLICIDEIQRKPDIFTLLRSITDEWGINGSFLILGSASRDLLMQSAETLAGRIRYIKLTPFLFSEINMEFTIEDYLLRGGFPRSLLNKSSKDSLLWREDFITTFLERDLLLWSGFSPLTMKRLWRMLAHVNGQTANYSNLGNSLGVSHNTIRNYIELLSETFMINLISPYFGNTKKRIIKAPKIYLSDQGILNALLNIPDFNHLTGHPVLGSLWETVVLSNLKGYLGMVDFQFYRTSNGAEIDFVGIYGDRCIAIECKASLSPSVSKGTYISMDDLGIKKLMVIAPVDDTWQKSENTTVTSLINAVAIIKDELQII